MDTMARWDLTVRRNDDTWSVPLQVVGLDLTNVAVHAQIRLAGDAPGTPLIDLSGIALGGSATATGIRLVNVSVANGVPTSLLSIQLAKADRQDVTKLPYFGEVGDTTVLAWGFQIAGITRLQGQVFVPPQVVGSDGAPANRPLSYGAANPGVGAGGGATLTIAADGGATLAIDGAGALGAFIVTATQIKADTQTIHDQTAAIHDDTAAIHDQTAAIGLYPLRSYRAVSGVLDGANLSPSYIEPSGRQRCAHLRAETLNSRDADAFIRGYRQQGVLTALADVLGIDFTGQSLMLGSYDITSPTAPCFYDGKVFSWLNYSFGDGSGAMNPTPGSQLPLVRGDGRVTGYADGNGTSGNPGVPRHLGMRGGCLDMIRQLLIEEDGIDAASHPLFFTGNNAIGGTPIATHIKGTDSYNRSKNQTAATRAYAQGAKLRARFMATCWGQGESDQGGGALDYYNALLLLAQIKAADARAAYPEQGFDPLLVTFSTASTGTANRYPVARAQHKLAIDHPELIALSGALYQFNYKNDAAGSYLHPRDTDKYLAGAAFGIALKRRLFDGVDYSPIRPLARQPDEAGVAAITYGLRMGRLIVDTGNIDVPPQPNLGILLYDENTSSAVTHAAPPRIAPDGRTILISPTGGPRAGLRIGFGTGLAVGKGGYAGGACNLRTTQGPLLRTAGRRVDDWMPVHEVRLIGSAPGFQLVL